MRLVLSLLAIFAIGSCHKVSALTSNDEHSFTSLEDLDNEDRQKRSVPHIEDDEEERKERSILDNTIALGRVKKTPEMDERSVKVKSSGKTKNPIKDVLKLMEKMREYRRKIKKCGKKHGFKPFAAFKKCRKECKSKKSGKCRCRKIWREDRKQLKLAGCKFSRRKILFIKTQLKKERRAFWKNLMKMNRSGKF